MFIKYRHSLLLAGIVLLGLLLRWYGLGLSPVSTYWDETAIGYDAYVVSETGMDMHGNPWWQAIYPSYGDYKLPLYIWLSSLAALVMENSIAAIRISSIFAGTGLILVVYFVSEELFAKREISLLSAAVVAVSPWAIQFSRTGFEANAGVLMLSLAILLLLMARKRPWLFLLAGIFGALSVYGYYSVRFVLPLLIGLYGLVYWKGLSKQHWAYLAGGGLICVLLLMPIYRSEFYEATNQYRLSTANVLSTDTYVLEQNVHRELAGNGRLARVLYHRYFFQLKALLQNMTTHLDFAYIFLKGDANLRHGTGQVGLFLLIWIVPFGYGLYRMASEHKKELLFLVGLWLISLVPASVPMTAPHALRSLNGLLPLVLVIGYGTGCMWIMWRKKRFFWPLVTVASLFLVVSLGSYAHDVRAHYPARSAEDWNYTLQQVGQATADVYSDYDGFIVSSENDRLFLYLMYYLNLLPNEDWVKDGFRFTQFDKIRVVEIDSYMIRDMDQSQAAWVTVDEWKVIAELVGAVDIVQKVTTLDGVERYYLVAKK